MERRTCRLLGKVTLSGLTDEADTSIDELRLPGVLPDRAGLAELTLALGSLRVVTES